VKKPVSKFAFQVHNLQRYTEVGANADDGGAAGLYKLHPLDLTHSLKAPGFNP
jgi:hypothetical protein